MALSQEQIKEEQQKEAALNKLSEDIISHTGWGRFYPLMRQAAAIGEGNIPHKVCLDQDGRNITVYNSDTGKIIGTFLKPAHEQASKDYSQGNYGWALADVLGMGWAHQLQQQQQAVCVTITPNDVLNRFNMSEEGKANVNQDLKASPNDISGIWVDGEFGPGHHLIHISGKTILDHPEGKFDTTFNNDGKPFSVIGRNNWSPVKISADGKKLTFANGGIWVKTSNEVQKQVINNPSMQMPQPAKKKNVVWSILTFPGGIINYLLK